MLSLLLLVAIALGLSSSLSPYLYLIISLSLSLSEADTMGFDVASVKHAQTRYTSHIWRSSAAQQREAQTREVEIEQSAAHSAPLLLGVYFRLLAWLLGKLWHSGHATHPTCAHALRRYAEPGLRETRSPTTHNPPHRLN